MAKKHYTIASEEGAVFVTSKLGALHEVGNEVLLQLEGPDQERALLAAGWLEEVKKGKKEG